MAEKLILVAIFAHPDDEAFGTGGTLAKYAHEGVDVHLITATLGEAGQIAQPDLAFTLRLSTLRRQSFASLGLY
jgi:N-acetyl-1-D-myo-inositol-2-amino-2-deoxy-alpha-D-glucopyranoside deacetylase